MADHVLQNGVIPESALDHVYYSENIKEKVTCNAIQNSATDHLPVVACYNVGKTHKKYFPTRSLKDVLKTLRMKNGMHA